MADKIYILGNDGLVTGMAETGYDSESELQKLLIDNPALLAGEQIDPDSPRRWLAICREMPIAGDDTTNATWRLDHLFLDQDAIPTLVEVKRRQNTEVRRKIVGQLLDYASNGVSYWKADTIRVAFENRCETEGKDPDQVFNDFIGEDADDDFDAEHFWKQAEANLLAGRVRLLFVADIIPAELQRIVTFLNKQMDPAEVLAVSVQRYVGGESTTLVPRLYGKAAKKGTDGATEWNAERFFQKVDSYKDATKREFVKKLYEWLRQNGFEIAWWDKRGVGRFHAVLKRGGHTVKPLAVRANGNVVIRFGDLTKHAAFADESRRRDLLEQFNTIAGVNLSHTRLTKGQMIDGAVLAGDHAWEKFTAILQSIAKTIPSD